MSLFKDRSLVIKQIMLDEGIVLKRYNALKIYQTKKNFIKHVKEEKFQETFLKDIFIDCLGYTLDTENPNNFNLTREEKTKVDGKKADGCIIANNKVVGVIELKGQNTKDLDKRGSRDFSPVEQAFSYLSSFDNKFAKYVIVSNFDEIRFYIKDRLNFESFNLLELDFENFKFLHALISFESIKEDLPFLLKERSNSQEISISKKFYDDYSNFRIELFENICKNNNAFAKQEALKFTQKICDRLIFILFAEDCGLLAKDTINRIIDGFSNDILNHSLYDYYKVYFKSINSSNEKLKIPAYNGGLFATDTILDSLNIDDYILNEKVKTLSSYDFNSEISVNILGHIFEQSLSDLEHIISSNFNKRKKDGIFYTPKFITSYILNQTLGEICNAKKEELGLNDITEPAKNLKKLNKDELKNLKNLNIYREFLLDLKILDPACGSGAFLNEALDFLIKEHEFIDNKRKLFENDDLGLYDIQNTVLENNLYGVDINAEAVEIAKLSLWLRTAQFGRKLVNLGQKIKCGNSLVDKEFCWEKEFSEVFEKGGFDIIVGNPPYISYQSNLLSKLDMQYFSDVYETPYKIYDTYALFIEKSIKLLNNNGKFGFIVPSTLLQNESFCLMREFIAKNTNIDKIVFCADGVFNDAVVPTIILLLNKNKEKQFVEILKSEKDYIYPKSLIPYNDFIKDPRHGFNISLTLMDRQILDKCKTDECIQNFLDIKESIKTGNDKRFISDIKTDTHTLRIVTGKEVSKFKIKGFKYFDFNEKELKRPTKAEYYTNSKLFIRRVGKNLECVFDDSGFFATHVLYVGIQKNSSFGLKAIMCILNSTLFNYLYQTLFPAKGDIFPEIRIGNLRSLPINNNIKNKSNELDDLGEKLMVLYSRFDEELYKFYNSLELNNIPNKIKKFYTINFDEFIRELQKSKKVNFKNKLEERNFKEQWQELFEHDKAIVINLQKQILQMQTDVDEIIFDSFELDKDEREYILNGK